MKLTSFKAYLAAALVAGAGIAAYAEDAPEEEVVAFGEAEFWLGPDEIVVATGEKEFALKPAWAWQVGDAAFAITNGVGELIVFGTGATWDFTKKNPAPWAAFASRITGAEIGPGVTGVGSQFFKGCTHLNTVTGGKVLAKLGAKAFYQCMSLEEIAIDNPEFDLETSGLADAIVLQSAIDEDGKVYVIPAVRVPGYKAVLKGTNDLGAQLGDWQTVDRSVPMKESGYHFFKYVLEEIR